MIEGTLEMYWVKLLRIRLYVKKGPLELSTADFITFTNSIIISVYSSEKNVCLESSKRVSLRDNELAC